MTIIVSHTQFSLWAPAKTMVLLPAATEDFRNASLLCKVLQHQSRRSWPLLFTYSLCKSQGYRVSSVLWGLRSKGSSETLTCCILLRGPTVNFHLTQADKVCKTVLSGLKFHSGGTSVLPGILQDHIKTTCELYSAMRFQNFMCMWMTWRLLLITLGILERLYDFPFCRCGNRKM